MTMATYQQPKHGFKSSRVFTPIYCGMFAYAAIVTVYRMLRTKGLLPICLAILIFVASSAIEFLFLSWLLGGVGIIIWFGLQAFAIYRIFSK